MRRFPLCIGRLRQLDRREQRTGHDLVEQRRLSRFQGDGARIWFPPGGQSLGSLRPAKQPVERATSRSTGNFLSRQNS
jgi:hypothetical protein